MDITVQFDTDAASAPAGFKACVNAACQYLDGLLTDPISVRIGVGYGTLEGQALTGGSLGQSSGSFQFIDYASAVSQLRSKGTPGAATLPGSAPNGASLVLSNAQAKALGFGAGGIDGYVGFATAGTTSWAYDPTGAKPISFNSYDFVATVLHEVTEVLGRLSFLDQSGEIGLLDLFRYASSGHLQTTTNGPSYFSVDGGATRLLAFNNYQTGDQGDLGDWASANDTNDSFNDNSYNGVLNPMSGTDKTLLQAIGYSETAASQALTVAGAVPTLTAAAAVTAVTSGQDAYVKVVDGGAGLSAALNGLETLAKGQTLAGISLSDAAPITLTTAQLTSAIDALNAISGAYTLAVSDSTANIQSHLSTLESDYAGGKLAALAATDSSYATLTVTPGQLAADQGMLGIMTGNFTLAVSAAGIANAGIAGLSGHGTVVDLSGTASQYTLTPNGDGVGFSLASASGTDHISSVTALSYGGTLDFVAASPGKADAITSGNITELYGAAFGREPDVPGLAFYQAYLKANPSVGLTSYATFFLSSPEYTGNSAHDYPETSAGEAQFITDCYQNLLHRTPAASEVTFYQNVITPYLHGLTPGSSAYAAADLQAHALVMTYFSQSPEFLSDVQITAQHPADASHWLYLI